MAFSSPNYLRIANFSSFQLPADTGPAVVTHASMTPGWQAAACSKPPLGFQLEQQTTAGEAAAQRAPTAICHSTTSPQTHEPCRMAADSVLALPLAIEIAELSHCGSMIFSILIP